MKTDCETDGSFYSTSCLAIVPRTPYTPLAMMLPSARVTVTRLLAFDNHRHRLSPVNLLLEMDVLPSALKYKPFVYNDKCFYVRNNDPSVC